MSPRFIRVANPTGHALRRACRTRHDRYHPGTHTMQTSLLSRRRASLLSGGAALLISLLSACDTERPVSPVVPKTPDAALAIAVRGPSIGWKMVDEDSALIAVAGSQFSVKGPNNF